MARPTKYTPEVAKKIVQSVRLGSTYELACAYAGISVATFGRWRNSYADFEQAIKEAEGAAVTGWLAVIEKAAQEGTWQAAAWKLERKYPQQYGRRVINSYEEIPVEKVPDLSDDELDNLYEQLIPRRRG